MDDSQQNLVEVRRSSGQKEWMTKEKLEALNKQRALKREKLKKPASRSTPKKKLTSVSIWLNALLLAALLVTLFYSSIDFSF